MYSTIKEINDRFLDQEISIDIANEEAKKLLAYSDLSKLSNKEIIEFSYYCDFYEPGYVIATVIKSPTLDRKQEIVDILNVEFELREKLLKSSYNIVQLVLSGKKVDQRMFFYYVSEWNYQFGAYNAQLNRFNINSDIGAEGQILLSQFGFLKYCTDSDRLKFKSYDPSIDNDLNEQVREAWGFMGGISAAVGLATVITTYIKSNKTINTIVDDNAADQKLDPLFAFAFTVEGLEYYLKFLSDQFQFYSESPEAEKSKRTPLYEAADQNNFESIEKILVNSQDPKNGIFELFWFMKEGNIQGIRNLLDCGVLKELQDTKKLAGLAFYAIQCDSENKIAILELLLSRGADIDSLNFSCDSLIQTAIETEQGEIVKYLLDKGADISTIKIDKVPYSMQAYLMEGTKHAMIVDENGIINDKNAIRFDENGFKVDKYGYNALDIAIIKQDTQAVADLLRNKNTYKTVNYALRNPLTMAFRLRNLEIINLLFDAGAVDMNLSTHHPKDPDWNTFTFKNSLSEAARPADEANASGTGSKDSNKSFVKLLEERSPTSIPGLSSSETSSKNGKLPLPAYTAIGSVLGASLGAAGCFAVAYAFSWTFPPLGLAFTIIGGCIALGLVAGAIVSKLNTKSTTPFLNNEERNQTNQIKDGSLGVSGS